MAADDALVAARRSWQSSRRLMEVACKHLPPEEGSRLRHDFEQMARQSAQSMETLTPVNPSTPLPVAALRLTSYLHQITDTRDPDLSVEILLEGVALGV